MRDGETLKSQCQFHIYIYISYIIIFIMAIRHHYHGPLKMGHAEFTDPGRVDPGRWLQENLEEDEGTLNAEDIELLREVTIGGVEVCGAFPQSQFWNIGMDQYLLNSILRGMNIQLNQLFWCELQGYYWFWPTAICQYVESISVLDTSWQVTSSNHSKLKRHRHVMKCLSCGSFSWEFTMFLHVSQCF